MMFSVSFDTFCRQTVYTRLIELRLLVSCCQFKHDIWRLLLKQHQITISTTRFDKKEPAQAVSCAVTRELKFERENFFLLNRV